MTINVPIKEYTLNIREELIVEKKEKDNVVIVLLQGNVEINGKEMMLEKEYEIECCHCFVWFQESIVQVIGDAKTYIIKDNLDYYNQLTNIGLQLSSLRKTAKNKDVKGPSVYICGEDTYLIAETLCNYATRELQEPIVFGNVNSEFNPISRLRNTIGFLQANEPFAIEHHVPQFQRTCFYIDKYNYDDVCKKVLDQIKLKTTWTGNFVCGPEKEEEWNIKYIQYLKPDIVFVIGNPYLHEILHTNQEIDSNIVICSLKKHVPSFILHKKNYQKQVLETCFNESSFAVHSSLKLMTLETLPYSALPLDTISLHPKYVETTEIEGKDLYAVIYLNEADFHRGEPISGCAKIRKMGHLFHVWCPFSNLKDAILLLI